MRARVVEIAAERRRVLNAVALQNAVLCAECDIVSDSPHDTCLVCGSHSLFNVARIFGGNLPKERARLTPQVHPEMPREILVFPKAHRPRRRTLVRSSQLPNITLDDQEMDEREHGLLAGPKGH
jgi:hypothetical protein